MRGFKSLLVTTALLSGLALAPAARAQVSVAIGVPHVAIDIGVPPVCAWGYYEAPPYGCAPRGFYGPGYFYNGIFLGVGPWAGWGYAHGWGGHRFIADGGGRYHGRAGYEAEHGHFAHGYDDRGHGDPHGEAAHHGGSAHHGNAAHHGGGEHR
ncbi:MAG: hypothetical protein ABR906_03170 [Terracidiphilus sp.]